MSRSQSKAPSKTRLRVQPLFGAPSAPPVIFLFFLFVLIKQSQDEEGDEVTWRISPVNERLDAKSKQLPGVMRVLADSTRLNSTSIQKCSLNKDSVTSSGKLEKWLSSPPPKTDLQYISPRPHTYI
ncbi:hypothetical protein AgCh_029069 [Apium graveolens]